MYAKAFEPVNKNSKKLRKKKQSVKSDYNQKSDKFSLLKTESWKNLILFLNLKSKIRFDQLTPKINIIHIFLFQTINYRKITSPFCVSIN